MGLLNFFFGRRAAEEKSGGTERAHPRYGQLADDENLAEVLRARNVAAERAEEDAAERAAPRLLGFERTVRRLSGRVRREQLTRWPKITRNLGKLEHRLGEAESAEDVRKLAKQALALAPRGLFRKIERGMEKRLTKLGEEGASRGEIRRYERDLRKLERRLKGPTRFLR